MPSAPHGGEGRCERSATWQRRAWHVQPRYLRLLARRARNAWDALLPRWAPPHVFGGDAAGIRAFGANRHADSASPGVSTVKLPPLALSRVDVIAFLWELRMVSASSTIGNQSTTLRAALDVSLVNAGHR
jgi:hypothetical protein